MQAAETLSRAIACHQAGRLAEAEALYRSVLSSIPGHPEACHNLARLALQTHHPVVAAKLSEAALRSSPGEARYWLGYADALVRSGQDNAARDALAQARARGAPAQAVAAVAERFDGPAPDEIERLLVAVGKAEYQAGEVLARLLATRFPESAFAWKALGLFLREQRGGEAAIRPMSHAVVLDPQDVEALRNLALVLQDLGEATEAVDLHRRAQRLQPAVLVHAVGACLTLPFIPRSAADIDRWRDSYRAGIAELARMKGSLIDAADELSSLSFQLAYHRKNDRPVMEALGRMIVPKLSADLRPASIDCQPRLRHDRRIRIGFMSRFLVGHTIGKLYQGILRLLDRGKFEVVVLHAFGTRHDPASTMIDKSVDRAVNLPAGLAAQCRAVAAEQLDILFHTDVGMTTASYFLACFRLAPVQVVGWGHPVTTGLETVDYFLSADVIEPDDGESHYTEHLVRLGRLPCFYPRADVSLETLSREDFGLPADETLYACPQSLFKFHPDFDAVLDAIVARDPDGRFVLLEGARPAWTNQLRARWARDFPRLLARSTFLPRMSSGRFMALMSQIDVQLDPLHFGSGNTFYEIMTHGTPVVTWPGEFMRGRIVAGAYRQMGLADAPVAAALVDYAALAVGFGRSPDRRAVWAEAAKAAAERHLFEDGLAVQEFEAFCLAAVAAHRAGDRLPRGWRPRCAAAQ